MPIKYNLTKYDLLSERIHDLAQKKTTTFSKDEETLRAQATLLASFASPHSWQTNKALINGDVRSILDSSEIKNEHALAKSTKWKLIKNTDIQEVARININGMFPLWLNSINADKKTRDDYRLGWMLLNKEVFSVECDGNTIVQSQR